MRRHSVMTLRVPNGKLAYEIESMQDFRYEILPEASSHEFMKSSYQFTGLETLVIEHMEKQKPWKIWEIWVTYAAADGTFLSERRKFAM